MNAGVQTKQAAKEMAPETVNEQQQTDQPKDGSAVLIQALKDQGVEVIFGYPGGAVLPIYDALYKNPISHVLARHEQGAIHAAEGYARVSGKTGRRLCDIGTGCNEPSDGDYGCHDGFTCHLLSLQGKLPIQSSGRMHSRKRILSVSHNRSRSITIK